MPRPVTAIKSSGECARCGSTSIGTRNRCKVCRSRTQREELASSAAAREYGRLRKRRWRAQNPLKAQAQDRRKRYNLTADDVNAMLVVQEQRCAICRQVDPDCVDHCHASGRFRGMLCRMCNAGLGQFRDQPALLLAAIRYLARHGKALDISGQTDDVSRPSTTCLVSSVGRAGD